MTEIFTSEKLEKIKERLQGQPKITITTHVRPDGDAMGSALALRLVLFRQGFDVDVIITPDLDHYLHWMPGSDKILNESEYRKEAVARMNKSDIIFCLDYGAIQRIGTLSEQLAATTAFKIVVDHHIDPEDFADVLLHDEKASSTAELIYKFIVEMGWKEYIDVTVGQLIYTGLVTDTGSFRYSNVNPDIHRITADLMERGLKTWKIHDLLFNNYREDRNKFLGYCLYEKMKVLPEYKTSYMMLSKEEMERFNLVSGDTEGLVNWNLTMKGIVFGVLLKQQKNEVRFSFRSVGDFPCNEFAAHFGGGGHKNASGGKMISTLEEAHEKFLSVLELFKDRLHDE